jgi:hypothetical protein
MNCHAERLCLAYFDLAQYDKAKLVEADNS